MFSIRRHQTLFFLKSLLTRNTYSLAIVSYTIICLSNFFYYYFHHPSKRMCGGKRCKNFFFVTNKIKIVCTILWVGKANVCMHISRFECVCVWRLYVCRIFWIIRQKISLLLLSGSVMKKNCCFFVVCESKWNKETIGP